MSTASPLGQAESEGFVSFSFRTKINAGFVPAFVILAVISVVSYRNTNLLVANAAAVTHTHEVVETIEQTLSQMKDLETGQRGYVITGDDDYLEPFQKALVTIDATLDHLQNITADNEKQQNRLQRLRKIKDEKVAELKAVIALRRTQGLPAAVTRVSENLGKTAMDEFRATTADMKNEELNLLTIRDAKAAESTRMTIWIVTLGAALSLLVILGASVLVNLAENERLRAMLKLENQNRLRNGLLQLSEKLSGEQSIAHMAKNVVDTLAMFVGAQIGAIYLSDSAGALAFAGGHGFENGETAPLKFKMGDGLVGQAAAQKTPVTLKNPPDHYLKIRSALGDADLKAVQVLPFVHEGEVKGVVELGTLTSFNEADAEYITMGLERIAVAFTSAQARAKIVQLLEETQAQSEELQVQQEELKTANEELQTKTQELEAQQEELRSTNEELEEQRTALEEQAERLEETNRAVEGARRELEEKAVEVERASRYKSEFLANMSHELRTPLNSILLLSKSLSENEDGNLTGDQQEICRTVYASGVDLLYLINDILDLSKVEAGKLDIKPGEVEVAELADAMKSLFQHQASAKQLAFTVNVGKSAPKSIVTDRLRLEQILKNFLSNSLKFTEKGSITLTFERASRDNDLSASGLSAESTIAIAVTDTGIGIPEEKKNKIFEAFEQIDSTTSRKYSGAGLGLTIATKLAQLLGGEIQVESTVGQGSRFVVYLPDRMAHEGRAETRGEFVPKIIPLRPGEAAAPAPIAAPAPAVARTGAHGIVDDRDKITARDKTILIVEDDPKFAKIVHGYCKKHGFMCLLAADGEAGLEDAFKYTPSAIILDLRLPGLGGMSVLSSLKRNAKTRHIPVHVASVDEKAADVLKMGAIGFLAKPAMREGIEAALQKIEDKLLTKARKVLVVEDKKVERDNILKLIASSDVECVGVDSGAEAIERLKKSEFDCMVLDLKLPDMTGFDLLQEIERDTTLARPPVIVYTGRDLTKDELEHLGRFSESIIIKGVRSEERLLDELTLFLHHVESELPEDKRQIIERVRHREEIFEGKKLLVVDDDMRNVFALRSVFSKKGFEVVVAKTGKEAIDKLHTRPDIDLVLMDVMMPEMDGYEAMRLIRTEERFSKLPIIALTAKAMPADRDKCLESGANDYLPKPIDTDHLMSLLRVWLTG